MENFSHVLENTTDNSNSSSSMEIASPPSYALPPSSELISDEWFKSRNEPVSSMDLDAVIKTDGMDSTYLDALGYHFLSPKDNIDMCIVTNICDMGLGLELPVNTCDKNKLGTLVSLNEKDCSGPILSDFQEQNPLLEDLTRNDILDKDILVEVDNSELNSIEKLNLLHSSNKNDQEILSVNYVLDSTDETLTTESNSLSKQDKEQENFGCENNETLSSQSLESSLEGKDKVNWESFIISRQSSDFDSDKDVDFSEFNLLTFQVDSSDGMNVVNGLPQVEYNDKELSESCAIPGSPLTPEPCSISDQCEVSDISKVLISDSPSASEIFSGEVLCEKEITNDKELPNEKVISNEKEDSNEKEAARFPSPNLCSNVTTDQTTPLNINVENHEGLIKSENPVPVDCTSHKSTVQIIPKLKPTIYVRPTNPRSLLKTPLRNIIQTKNIISSRQVESGNSLKRNVDSCGVLASVSSGQENLKSVPKKKVPPPSMAIIAISTNKSKNTTEIVINTSHGEQKFKGKTSDLMKATSNMWSKIDNSVLKAKIGQSLNLASTEVAPPADGNLANEDLYPWLKTDLAKSPTGTEVSPPCPAGLIENDLCPWLKSDLVRNAAVEQPITEALAELGVDIHSLTCVVNSKRQKLWACPNKECSKIFPRLSMLKVHILTHYGVRPYKCDYVGCHWTFYTYFKLKRHRETHLKRKLFICPVTNCGRRFTTIYNLNTHQKLHDRPAEMVCPVESCNARFQTKRSMELHMKKHDSQHAPYKCTFEGCGKHYYSANSYNSHVRSHQYKEEELRCQWEGCGKLFDKPCRLKAHMRTHTGDKPYSCTFKDCGWAFSSASKLKRHQHKHTNERRFRCSFEGCNKSFMRSEHLKEHTLTHIGERTFHCTVENCGVKFSAKSSLYVHLKKHNNAKQKPAEKVVYHCQADLCNRRYSSKASLRQHMLLAHSPLEASGSGLIDYSTLMSGEEDLVMLESLQLPSDLGTPPTGGMNMLNTSSLLPPSTMLSNGGDGLCSIGPEYMNTDLQLQSVLGTEGITSSILATPESQSSSFLLNESDSDSGMPRNSVPMLDMPETDSSEDDLSCGSARTNYTYQDIIRNRENKNGAMCCESNFSPVSDSPSGLRLPTDVILGIGMLGNTPDITNNILLQDDHHSTYQEDAGISGVGEFQVLLLDPGGNTQQEFPESTINLRDLE